MKKCHGIPEEGCYGLKGGCENCDITELDPFSFFYLKCDEHPCNRCDTATVFDCCAAECEKCKR